MWFGSEFVRLGEHTLFKEQDCEQGLCAPRPQDIPVEQIISHPQYGSQCKECNDIALLRLSRPAQMNPRKCILCNNVSLHFKFHVDKEMLLITHFYE